MPHCHGHPEFAKHRIRLIGWYGQVTHGRTDKCPSWLLYAALPKLCWCSPPTSGLVDSGGHVYIPRCQPYYAPARRRTVCHMVDSPYRFVGCLNIFPRDQPSHSALSKIAYSIIRLSRGVHGWALHLNPKQVYFWIMVTIKVCSCCYNYLHWTSFYNRAYNKTLVTLYY